MKQQCPQAVKEGPHDRSACRLDGKLRTANTTTWILVWLDSHMAGFLYAIVLGLMGYALSQTNLIIAVAVRQSYGHLGDAIMSWAVVCQPIQCCRQPSGVIHRDVHGAAKIEDSGNTSKHGASHCAAGSSKH